MSKKLIITIDGPASAGKSVLGERVAQALNYLYFDTGVLYRALTFIAQEVGISPDDEEALVALLSRIRIEVRPSAASDGRQNDILVDGRDITWNIRTAAVDRAVSTVSAHRRVREAMLQPQREIARQGGVVLVGRDTGTVVCPNADVKIYLDASPEVRAKRRYAERLARGDRVDYATVLEDLHKRDELDESRAIAPTRPAPDAHIINNEHMSLEDEVRFILHLVEQHSP